MQGVDMNVEYQLHLLTKAFPQFSHEYNSFPFEKPKEDHLFYFNNDLFSGTDALVLYCMVRHFKPKRLFEIGSGISTTISAQAALLNGNTEVVALEPYPNPVLRRGFPGLSRLIIKPIEQIESNFFNQLESGDVLFIDTSHVVKIGGDVNQIYLEILPRLRPGVLIHIHDIYFPFDYKQEWVLGEHRFWTEQYLVQTFLMFNSEFEVLFANTHMDTKYPEQMRATFPRSNFWGGGSLWIRRKP
jgi:hypothetical protein